MGRSTRVGRVHVVLHVFVAFFLELRYMRNDSMETQPLVLVVDI